MRWISPRGHHWGIYFSWRYFPIACQFPENVMPGRRANDGGSKLLDEVCSKLIPLKLHNLNRNPNVLIWIKPFLTVRSQYMDIMITTLPPLLPTAGFPRLLTWTPFISRRHKRLARKRFFINLNIYLLATILYIWKLLENLKKLQNPGTQSNHKKEPPQKIAEHL